MFISPFDILLATIGRLKISGVSVLDDGNRYRCQPKYTNLISRAATLSVPGEIVIYNVYDMTSDCAYILTLKGKWEMISMCPCINCYFKINCDFKF